MGPNVRLSNYQGTWCGQSHKSIVGAGQHLLIIKKTWCCQSHKSNIGQHLFSAWRMLGWALCTLNFLHGVGWLTQRDHVPVSHKLPSQYIQIKYILIKAWRSFRPRVLIFGQRGRLYAEEKRRTM